MYAEIRKFEEQAYWSSGKDERNRIFESMMSRFNNGVQAARLFPELKRREFYEKPNELRRRKKHEAILKRMKKDRRRGNAVYKTRFEGQS